MGILVTGGAGFVGREVTRRLVAAGADVAVFSRAAAPARLGDLAGRVEAIAGDIGNFSHVLNAVERARPDTIYHLGAMLSGAAEADPAGAMQTNVMGAFHVLEAARLFGVARVVFSSTIAVYGRDLGDGAIDDRTLQRPTLFYGATKLFGEHMGLFYRRKYGLDFRGLRYPSVVGPGVENPGVVQFASLMIERAALGAPFDAWVAPETRVPMMYLVEAAAATIQLAEAPADAIRAVNYLVDGAKPTPSAAEIAAAVRARFPDARIGFAPDPDLAPLIADLTRPIDDASARAEWGWRPTHDLTRLVDAFLADRASV